MSKKGYKKPPFELKRNDGRTLVDQAVEGMRRAIVSGYYKPGDVIPPVRELAKMLGVSRIVTNAVNAKLEEEGWIDPRPRLGSMVLEATTKRWYGHVYFIYRNNPGSYYPNFLASEVNRRLIFAGYVFTQLAVLKDASGKYDFAALDASTDRNINLTLLMFNDGEIERHLGKLGVPFAVIGKNACRLKGCVGNVRFHRELTVPDFVLDCRVNGVKNVLQVGQISGDTQAVPALRRAGIEAEEWVIPPLSVGFRPEIIERAALEAFAVRLAGGRDWLPEVLFFTDDCVARGAITALYEYGIRVPDDVCVVTWSNRGNGPVQSAPLTRMEMDPVAHGLVIANCVLSYLKGAGFPEDITIGPRYVQGESFPARRSKQTKGS